MFKDPKILNQINQLGFVLIDAKMIHETDKLNSFLIDNFRFQTPDFYYSLLENNFSQNKVIGNTLSEVLNQFYQNFFTEIKILNQSFLSKPANSKEELLLHQDWCYTDNKKYSSYNIWIPLTDTTEKNGAMFFIPGSHLWFDNIISASLPTARISTSKFPSSKIHSVSVKKGQVLIFHPAVFHGSFPNFSEKNRIVVTSTILQKNAPFLYFHQSEIKDEVRVFSLEEDAFLKDLKSLAMGGAPTSKEIKRIKYLHSIITEQELKLKIFSQQKL